MYYETDVCYLVSFCVEFGCSSDQKKTPVINFFSLPTCTPAPPPESSLLFPESGCRAVCHEAAIYSGSSEAVMQTVCSRAEQINSHHKEIGIKRSPCKSVNGV